MAERKILKYSANIIFQSVAFETLGPIYQCGVDFISEIGRCKLKQVSGDARGYVAFFSNAFPSLFSDSTSSLSLT